MEFSVKKWFDYAIRDLATAIHAYSKVPSVPLEHIQMHCHQAGEKALYGYLAHKGVNPPDSRDLSVLLDFCASLDSSMAILGVECETLSRRGYTRQYTSSDTINAVEARIVEARAAEVRTEKLLAYARNVISFTASLIPDLVLDSADTLTFDRLKRVREMEFLPRLEPSKMESLGFSLSDYPTLKIHREVSDHEAEVFKGKGM